MKKKISIHGFELAIKREYGCLSALNTRQVINELFQDQSVWQGEVLTFDLLNNPATAPLVSGPVMGTGEGVGMSFPWPGFTGTTFFVVAGVVNVSGTPFTHLTDPLTFILP